ncbi:MAG: PAS domain S-box protein [Acidimicrobiia bacterium]|nr:PAS domain S-box protein [Acidimicrobiia bacterium]
MRILLAEDDADVVRVCEAALSARGHSVTSVTNGTTALDRILANRPDVILLDVMLPGLRGTEVVRALRANADTQSVPVVLLSALVGTDEQRQGLEAGADMYFKKPFTPRELAAAVEAIGGTTADERQALRQDSLAFLADEATNGDASGRADRRQEVSGEPLLAGVLDLAVDAIVSIDENQRVIGFNRGAEHLFGYLAEEVLDKPLDVLLPERVAEAHRSHVQRFADTPVAARLMGERQEIFGRRRDGSEFPAEASIVKLEEDGRRRFAAILRDATERRAAEEAHRARARQQAAVAALGQQALSGIDTPTLMAEAVEAVASVLAADYAEILQLEPSTQTLLMRAGAGWDASFVGVQRVEAGPETQAGYTLANREPTIVDDLRTEARFEGSPALRRAGVVSGMSVTISGPAQPFGILSAHTVRGRRFTGDDIHFLQAVANVLGAAIERDRTEERLRGFLEAAPDATVVVDRRGRIVSANRQVETLFGYDRSEVIGLAIEALVPERLRDVHTRHRSEYMIDTRTRPMGAGLNLHGRRKDGKEVPVDIMLSPLDTDEGKLVVAAIRDVTERRRVESVREAFLRAVSHELRTPLTAVVGYAEILDDAALPPEQRQMAARLAVNARKLDRLLSDLLDLDRLARGVLQPHRSDVDVDGTLHDLIADFPLPGYSVTVDVEPPGLEAFVDPAQLERIVENLLANVARHTPVGTPVWLRARRGPNGLLVLVEDAGPGIADDLRARLFEPFQRGDTPAHSPGTGIGLSLVAHFAELHGGRAWVEERVGGGASFRVLLADIAAT